MEYPVNKIRADFLRANGLNAEGIVELILEYNQGKGNNNPLSVPSEKTATRWLTGERCPNLETLLVFAEKTHTNISYILYLTDIAAPCDSYYFDFNLAKVRKTCGFTREELSKAADMNYVTVSMYENKGLKQQSLSPCIAFARALNCSLEYVLGLSLYRNWGDDTRTNGAFMGIAPGSAVRVIAENLNSNALISLDGKSLILPDGKSMPLSSKQFKNAEVRLLKE